MSDDKHIVSSVNDSGEAPCPLGYVVFFVAKRVEKPPYKHKHSSHAAQPGIAMSNFVSCQNWHNGLDFELTLISFELFGLLLTSWLHVFHR